MIAFGISRGELKIFLERSLSEKERRLLLDCYRLQGYTFSALVKKLTGYGYPESTVKFVLRRLKYLNLMDFGDIESKGKPLTLTDLGKKFSEILDGGESK